MIEVIQNIKIRPINEIPDGKSYRNAFICILWETSLFPEIILIQHYKEFVKKWTTQKAIDDRGSLIGWFYAGEILSHKNRLLLTHIAAANDYYKNIEL